MATDAETEAESLLPSSDEWAVGRRSLRPRPKTAVVVLAVLGWAGAFAYAATALPADEPVAFGWSLTRLDWLFVLTLIPFVAYVVVPLVQRPRLTREYWAGLRSNPRSLAGFAFLVGFFVVGLVGPALVSEPTVHVFDTFQPPAFTSVDAKHVPTCVGPVANGQCYGTMQYPLGTTQGGRSILNWVVYGTRIALELAMVTSVILVPMAMLVGTTAAYVGGRVDEVLMRYVDVQQVVPPFFVYIILRFVYDETLFLFVAVFGLLNWGSMARLVRSDALSQREEAYMTAARSIGGSRTHVLRQHVIPNVSATVVTALTVQIPVLILTEAALAFLQLSSNTAWSWGRLAAGGLGRIQTYPWITVVPVGFLFLTALAFNVFGDGLRDALDPRTE